MGDDDDVETYTALGIPFNHFDGSHGAEKLRLNPRFFAKFPQGGLAQGLPGRDPAAREREQSLHGRAPAACEHHAIPAKHGGGGRKERLGGIEAVGGHRTLLGGGRRNIAGAGADETPLLALLHRMGEPTHRPPNGEDRESGAAGQASYAASKSGLVGFSRSLARELGSRGITANVVAPGYVDTDMTAALPESRRDEILKSIPLARTATADEIAAVVAFLARDEAAYVSGALLPVDGGLGMGH